MTVPNERELRARLDESPNDAMALRELAVLLSRARRRKEEAVELWRRFVEVAPPGELPAALLELGRAQMESRRELDARVTLERCVAEAPENAEAHDLLGELLQRAGRLEEAIGMLERAAELDPDSLRPRLALITCLDALGREEDADQVLEDLQSKGAREPAVAALLREIMHRRS